MTLSDAQTLRDLAAANPAAAPVIERAIAEIAALGVELDSIEQKYEEADALAYDLAEALSLEQQHSAALRTEIARIIVNSKRTDCTAETLLLGCRMIGQDALSPPVISAAAFSG